jgi:subfamily B ATP-binding cassette protein MsbA
MVNLKNSHFVRSIRLLLDLLGEKKLRILATCLGTAFVLVGVETLFAISLQSALNSLGLTALRSERLPEWLTANSLLPLVLFVILAFVRAAVISVKSYSMHWAFQSVTLNNRLEIFEKGIYSAEKLGLHELIDVFNEKVNSAARAIAHLINFTVMGTTVVVLFLTGLYMSPEPILLALTFMYLSYIPLQRLNKRIRKLGKNINSENLLTTQLLVQGLRQNFFLKAYDLVEQEVVRAHRLMNSCFQSTMRYQVFANTKSLLPMSFGMTILLLITYYFKNYTNSTYDLLSFFYIILRLNQGVSEVNQSATEILFHSKQVEDLREFKAKLRAPRKSAPAEQVGSEGPPAPISRIELRDVTFSYHGKGSLFDPINVELAAGDFWVINGPSGVGKSTIISLLLKINSPLTGEILVNGEEISKTAPNYIQRLGYSGADPYLIPATIRENLLFGNPTKEKVGDNDLFAVLRLVELEKVIDALPKRLDEKLNELATLSTGQKQRLSLARAILKRPELLLLDEATSHLDYELEERILRRIREQFPKQITIFISHRLKSSSFETKRLILDVK